MARIKLENMRHSYLSKPGSVTAAPEDWALKNIDLTWDDGGAYALLGSSGCGKTTLLNLISGLLHPSEGRIVFDDEDVTSTSTEQRNIAQVFQFPVVYDTMTVFDNLAFPLRNRKVAPGEVNKRVTEIAEMLDLTGSLHTRASGLTADGKQKISLGRGLVRADVNAILFDEPLTVIDPHLKWQLRSKLKELHQRSQATMIYVTHDQTEALTFADQVVVMHDGMIVQTGTPVELFENPQHTFVGHFIGSPGMNLLDASYQNGQLLVGNQPVSVNNLQDGLNPSASAQLQVGVRPEFVTFASSGLPVTI
ncbi:MAG: ABC transporter ATP-binding protein, partial [Gammaproteobacteria bacterium]|nr:ABC transporter ATP-binding protein [Gammaproteobacteria bacterium]